MEEGLTLSVDVDTTLFLGIPSDAPFVLLVPVDRILWTALIQSAVHSPSGMRFQRYNSLCKPKQRRS